MFGLFGVVDCYDIVGLKVVFGIYVGFIYDDLCFNFVCFLEEVILIVVDLGINMCIYFDDLLCFIFGLFWIVLIEDDICWIM